MNIGDKSNEGMARSLSQPVPSTSRVRNDTALSSSLPTHATEHTNFHDSDIPEEFIENTSVSDESSAPSSPTLSSNDFSSEEEMNELEIEGPNNVQPPQIDPDQAISSMQSQLLLIKENIRKKQEEKARLIQAKEIDRKKKIEEEKKAKEQEKEKEKVKKRKLEEERMKNFTNLTDEDKRIEEDLLRRHREAGKY